MADDASAVYVSAASACAIATKVRIGKLEWPPHAGSVSGYARSQGFRALPISLEHAERAGQLRIAHRDPFDRMLIAQAQMDEMWLVSNEHGFDSLGVRRYW
jgi:PIN domain nuclease of toxin-antitoxin system